MLWVAVARKAEKTLKKANKTALDFSDKKVEFCDSTFFVAISQNLSMISTAILFLRGD